MTIKLAGNKRRSFSSQGGLLNRMFGGSSSPPKEKIDSLTPSGPKSPSPPSNIEHSGDTSREKKSSPTSSSPPPGSTNDDTKNPAGEKKRRSSSVHKAASFLNSARNSFNFSSKDSQREQPPAHQTHMQKLGKMDPALVVPQGSLNNSAGESLPTVHSSFQVGVTEDKNRKCRRTMEDTHAYLYNFLGAQTPTNKPEASSDSKESKDSEDSISASAESGESIPRIETDNGYFAIFDGHAGTFAAEWCGKKLHLILEDIMRRHPNTPVPELLDQAFTNADQQLDKLPVKNSGCTVATAVLRWEDRVTNVQAGANNLTPTLSAGTKQGSDAETSESLTHSVSEPLKQPASHVQKADETTTRHRVLYTANVGDARIVLCRNGKALRLSYDHKGSDENEGKRISNSGGLILSNRVNGVLAVTRALGDSYMKDLVTGHPYTTETIIQPDADEFLILACDGVSDFQPLESNLIMSY